MHKTAGFVCPARFSASQWCAFGHDEVGEKWRSVMAMKEHDEHHLRRALRNLAECYGNEEA